MTATATGATPLLYASNDSLLRVAMRLDATPTGLCELAVAAVVVVAGGFAPLTGTGVAGTLATGAYTAAFAVLQYLGVRRLA